MSNMPYGFDPTLSAEWQARGSEQSWQSPSSGMLYPRLDEMYPQPKPTPEGPPVPPPPPITPEGPPMLPPITREWQQPEQPTTVQRDSPTPYTSPIAGGRLTPGRMIRVRGIPRGSGFAVNLQTGAHGGTIALHVNVRFTSADHGVVVRNSKINGSWGTEERHSPHFLFRKGMPFEILILADGSNYKIAVNNQHFVDYAHRVQLEETDTIGITGDVKVDSIEFY